MRARACAVSPNIFDFDFTGPTNGPFPPQHHAKVEDAVFDSALIAERPWTLDFRTLYANEPATSCCSTTLFAVIPRECTNCQDARYMASPVVEHQNTTASFDLDDDLERIVCAETYDSN